jgi:hypothetical protein
MVRVLRNLSVQEISSVLKGAGEDCKVMIWKRADSAARNNEAASEDGSELGNLARMIRALVRAGLTEQAALHHLLFSAHGRALAQHLNEVSKTTITRKDEQPMSRTEALHAVTKQYGGVVKLCKNIVTTGDSIGITEAELTKLIDDEAQKTRKAGERPNAAFARFYDAPENVDLRKAVQIAKRALMDVTPVMVGGDAVDVNDVAEALRQLQALAEQQRARAPWQSKEQAFAAVFDANPELAAMAHRRPAPTTRYEFPR